MPCVVLKLCSGPLMEIMFFGSDRLLIMVVVEPESNRHNPKKFASLSFMVSMLIDPSGIQSVSSSLSCGDLSS